MIYDKIDKMLDYIDVPAIYGIVFAITFTDIETALKVLSFIIATGYTCWKWITEYKKKRRK